MKTFIYISLLGLACACSTTKTITAPPEVTNAETPVVIKKDSVPIETAPIITVTEDITTVNAQAVEMITEPEEVDIPNPIITETVNHDSFNDLLKAYVSPTGNVDYNGFKSNWGKLRNYIKLLGEQTPTDAWSQEEKLAYWMNAYNAMTIDLILRHYPLESIKDIKNPWDQRFWKLEDSWYNLNQIEHNILRKMGDARIHFGINCASFSCPPLLNEAFTAASVDDQLDKLARNFINDSSRNTITTERVEVSKIFSWFAKDFKTEGSLIDYLNKYATTPISPSAKVRYKTYDWTLNK
ncbi:DUF547 domain-containing protein [Dokdonia donghaensis]|nr:DUF547 domain-containing protein [Dokdonia donghaensis]ANH59053.1 hypothetical protein I597_0118 [Dokdonia donghaensis DSW-1]